MKVFKTIESLQDNLSIIDKDKTLGFVPTMGALHEGHLSIVKKAIKENDYVIVSIFVNPTQFDKKEDLIKYPNTLEKDLELLEAIGCDFVFNPTADEIYSANIKSESFDFDGLDEVMEGAFRKGHFDGVGTIVKKLFELVKPDKAYFGEKDFQQLQIIKKMVAIHKIPVQIIACDIYREKDGLAMSSRNTRLNKAQRSEAPLIYQTLLKSKDLFLKKDINFVKDFVNNAFDKNEVLKLEYFEIADSETLRTSGIKIANQKYRAFIAVFAGNVRLIDNIALN
ncbi:MAG: pantoate--beta-alanine ligase [Flavobacteriaceae bacterium]|nr:pantoate--beta-alanine ligase [Flavobacteriaceae bacterium]